MSYRNCKNFVINLLIIFLLASSIYSAPLTNIPQKLVQPDGRILNCFASGDEYHNWLHDKDNYTIIQHPTTGYYVYAVIRDGQLVPSNYIVNDADPIDLGLEVGVNLSPETRYEKFLQKQSAMNYTTYAAPTTGEIKNLVVYIRFSDESEFTQLTSTYDNMFNSTVAGYNSMYNYYQEVSYNTLDITSTFYPTTGGTTVVSYQDGNPRSYYQVYNAVTNPNGYQGDTERRTREHALLRDAVLAINSQVPIGLNLDGDNDGNVDNVCFIVKGSPDGWSELLWPHMWSLYTYNVSINGKRVYTFNFQLETSLASSGVGVLCHEMFHSIGAPDLYHYTSNGIGPVGKWDLMEQNLNPPQHMGAYMKNRYGNWISSIPEILSSGEYTLNPLVSSSNNCYKIASPNSSTEYFIVEYRKSEGTFESSLPGSGLIIYRINSSADGNGNSSGPPDEVYVYRPNGTLYNNGSVDLANYSSDEGRTAINDLTNPSSFLSSGSAGGLDISNIGSSESTISFDVTIGGPQSSILVTSPNGGESWEAGLNKTITWGSVGLSSSKLDDTRSKTRLINNTNTLTDHKKINSITNITNVKIEYSTNNGSDWIEVVASTSNDGSYSWVVPNTPSSECKVNISDVADPGVSDESDAAFSISAPGSTITSLDEDFELYSDFVLDFSPWTLLDVDGSTTYGSTSFDFTNENSPMVFIIFNPSNTTPPASATWDPHGGNKYAACFASTTPPNNDWLISPQVTPGSSGELKFWARSLTSQYGLERFKVGVSSTGTSPQDFTIISAGSYLAAPTVWTQYTFDLSAYEGADIYVGINCVSDDAFAFMVDDVTITSQQIVSSITIVSPNGGEVWDVGSSHEINWSSTGLLQRKSKNDFLMEISNVKIEYSTDNGSNWNTVIESTENDDSYLWEIPDSPSQNCLVKISDTSDPDIYDISDSIFEIKTPVAPTITIVSPNGGEVWNVGSSYDINWGSTLLSKKISGNNLVLEISNVKIEYSTNNGNDWTTVIDNTSNDGSYSWEVPDTPSLNCLVKISDVSDPAIFDVSDNIFEINETATPTITVISPDGGEVWDVGSSHDINWESTLLSQKISENNLVLEISNVKIEYSINNGSDWTTVIENTSNDGSYLWEVPNTPSINCLVKVSDASDPAIFDVSDNIFEINETIIPTITILSPNGGEVWDVGSTHSITWNSIGLLKNSKYINGILKEISNLKIEYSTNNGGDWSTIIESTSNDGSYSWHVPDPASDSCFIRVSDQSDPLIFDISDAAFEIKNIATSSITVLKPNGGEELLIGENYNISWTSEGVDRVDITYSTNNGSNWNSIVSNLSNLGVYSWTLPDTPSDECLLQVINSQDLSVSDISDETFTLFIPDNITVTIPNGGETYEVGMGIVITWVSEGAPASLLSKSIEDGTISSIYEKEYNQNDFSEFFQSITSVKIEYSTNYGSAWIEITTDHENTGTYPWLIPDTPSDQCLIRISDNDNSETFDESNSTFTIVSPLPAVTMITEDFEGYSNFNLACPPWTFLDVDGSSTYGIDSYDFPNENSQMAFILFNPNAATPPLDESWAANSGAKYLASFASTSPPNNDWLISERVSIGENYVLSFWVKSISDTWGLERFRVGISSLNPLPDDFTIISEGDYLEAPTEWTKYTFELSSLLGEVYIGINCVSNDAFVFMIDDMIVDEVTSIGDDLVSVPNKYVLYQNYPNPFNPSTSIIYDIPEAADVTLTVYDVLGNEVAVLVDELKMPGRYAVDWNGIELTSGIYFYQMRTAKYSKTYKMIMLK